MPRDEGGGDREDHRRRHGEKVAPGAEVEPVGEREEEGDEEEDEDLGLGALFG